MLALYHLFSGASAKEFPGLEAVIKTAGIEALPKVNRAVLVGTELNPAQSHRKKDGTETHTLWGELRGSYWKGGL